MNTTITPMMYRMMPWIAAFAFFMQMLDTSILNTALPSIAVDLNESPLHMQSAVISYAVTLALFIPLTGYLSDRFGTQRVFIFSVFLFSFGSLLCALSYSLLMLDLSRVVQGIGGAMMMPVSRLVMLKSFKRNEFLKAFNTSTIPGLVGPIIGPALGGYLVEVASWHWIFLINIPVGIVGIICAFKFMPNIKGDKTKFDMLGYIYIAIGIVLITVGLELFNIVEQYFVPSLFTIVSFLLFILYALHANKINYALFPLSLFKIRTFRIGIVGNLISRFGISAVPFLMPLLLQVSFNYPASTAGLLMMPMAFGLMLMKTAVQPILGRFGYKRSLIINTMLVGIIISLLSLLTKDTPIVIISVMLFCLGMVNSLQFTAMNSITLADLQGSQTSSGNGFMAMNQQLAVSLGIAFAATLLHIYSIYFPVSMDGETVIFKYSFISLGFITFSSSLIFYLFKPEDGQNLLAKNNT